MCTEKTCINVVNICNLAIYAHNSLSASQIKNDCLFKENVCESILIKFSKNGLKSLCLCLYRPNTHATYNTNNQIEAFIEYFTEILEFIDSFNIPTIVTGDFNLNLFGATDINSHPTSLLDLCIFYNLLQCISRATRITPNSATLIDLTFIKGLMPNLICSGVITTDISDHFCNFVLIKTDRVKIKKEPPKYKRLINDETTLSFLTIYQL